MHTRALDITRSATNAVAAVFISVVRSIKSWGGVRGAIVQLGSFTLACIALTVSFAGCSRTNTNQMQPFVDKISHGPEAELGVLIYGYNDVSPGAQQVLIRMVRPLRSPSPEKHIVINGSRSAGRFTMLSVIVPWQTQGNGLQPILICHDANRDLLVGYVLPFDDIMSQFHGTDMQDIMHLSMWWTQAYGKP